VPFGFTLTLVGDERFDQAQMTSERSGVIRLADARARIPGPAGEHAVGLLDRGTLKVKLSCPVRPNQQTPHTQDEIYVIVRGRGVLVHDGKRDEVGPGDLMFVAAGTEHRFEDFTDDLTVWVVFFGPEGGEVPR
jgi:mannose-6-phosphate isomerase-like protein (cupin superfamily)